MFKIIPKSNIQSRPNFNISPSTFNNKFVSQINKLHTADQLIDAKRLDGAFQILNSALNTVTDAEFMKNYNTQPKDIKSFFGCTDSWLFASDEKLANDLKARASAYVLLTLSPSSNEKHNLASLLGNINNINDIKKVAGNLLAENCHLITDQLTIYGLNISKTCCVPPNITLYHCTASGQGTTVSISSGNIKAITSGTTVTAEEMSAELISAYNLRPNHAGIYANVNAAAPGAKAFANGPHTKAYATVRGARAEAFEMGSKSYATEAGAIASASIDGAVAINYVESSKLTDKVQDIFIKAGKTYQITQNWESIEGHENFLLFLTRATSEVRDLQHPNTEIRRLAKKILADIIVAMDMNTSVRTQCINVAISSLGDCGDAINIGFLRMQLIALKLDYSKSDFATLFRNYTIIGRFEYVAKITELKINTLRNITPAVHFDKAEVHLAFLKGMKDVLGLTIHTMHYANWAHVDNHDIQNAQSMLEKYTTERKNIYKIMANSDEIAEKFSAEFATISEKFYTSFPNTDNLSDKEYKQQMDDIAEGYIQAKIAFLQNLLTS